MFVEKLTNKMVDGSEIIGKWPDGSEKTVAESIKVDKDSPYLQVSDMTVVRKSEVFELACRILVGQAQAGIKPMPEDAVEAAKKMYHLKELL